MENYKPFSCMAVVHPKGAAYRYPVIVCLTQQTEETPSLLSNGNMIFITLNTNAMNTC